MRRLTVLAGIPRRRPASAKLPKRTTCTNRPMSFRSSILTIPSKNGGVKSDILIWSIKYTTAIFLGEGAGAASVPDELKGSVPHVHETSNRHRHRLGAAGP